MFVEQCYCHVISWRLHRFGVGLRTVEVELWKVRGGTSEFENIACTKIK
jgi:hypothetical protein